MNLSGAIQESLVALYCYDASEETAVVRASVRPGMFDPFYREIALSADEYWNRYDAPPGEHTLDLIDALGEREPKKKDVYDRIFRSIEETRDGINRKYILAQASRFARHQRLKAGIERAIDEVQKDDDAGLDAAEAALRSSLDATIDLFDPGTFFADTERSLRFLDVSDEDVFLTGVKEFDAVRLGPQRKRLHLFLGMSGLGKSWWLLQLAKFAVLDRKRVLYVTLEMPEEEAAQRLVQAFFSMKVRRAEEVWRTLFETDDDGSVIGFDAELIEDRPAFDDPGIRAELVRRLRDFKKRPPLLIKEFPTGTLSVSALSAFLKSLEGTQGFIPDLLLVDYPDLMEVSGSQDSWKELGEIVKGLRGIAVAQNIAVAAVSQGNRGGAKTRLLTGSSVAGSFDKIATADVVLTYNQTQEEYERGLARIHVDKARYTRAKSTILVSQAYAVGQFCIDSMKLTGASYWDVLKGEDADYDEEEE